MRFERELAAALVAVMLAPLIVLVRMPLWRGFGVHLLRDVGALAGVVRRNYDYDRFWVAFPLKTAAQRSFAPGDQEAELVVRIYDKEGHVEWPVPPSMRAAAGQR